MDRRRYGGRPSLGGVVVSFTYEELVWMGGDTQLDVDDGSITQLYSASEWTKNMPIKRAISVHIALNGVPPEPATLVLPDARTLPLGGPLYNFIVTADPGTLGQIRILDINQAGGFFLYVNVPASIKWYCADNTFSIGLWGWQIRSFITAGQSDASRIVSFGNAPGATTGAIDKYAYLSNIWTTEPDSGQNWYRCGASYTGQIAVIRKSQTVWTHTAGITALNNVGFANIDKCSFARLSSSTTSTRHYAFGNFDIAPVNDYWERIPNTFTILPASIATGWTQSTSAGSVDRAGVEDFLVQNISDPIGAQPTWIFLVDTVTFQTAQPIPTGTYHWMPTVSFGSALHVMGGATHSSTLFPGTSQWHWQFLAGQISGFAGWLAKTWLPNQLRGHGVRELPGETGNSRCLIGMGRDDSFFPSDNVFSWRHDIFANTFTVVSGSTWTQRQEQEASWALVD